MAQFYDHVEVGQMSAVEIAETLGARLGCLLLALLCNDEQTRRANPEKGAAYWTHWSTVRTVYLGGGLVSGKAGQIIAAQAQEILQKLANDPNCQVIQAAYPRELPLIGAARIVQQGERALVMDFGGSYIKRATVHYGANGLQRLHLLDSLPSGFPHNGDDVPQIFERIGDIIAQSYSDSDAAVIPISIAAYVDKHGQPLAAQSGIYMQLARLTSNLPAALSQTVSERIGKAVEVRILHDGTAAALVYAPLEQAAIMMIGTALGSGYPVDRPNLPLRPVSPDFSVSET
jgi:hypothetical protein